LAVSRNIRIPRITEREERLKPDTRLRDEAVVKRRKILLEKKASRPKVKAKRARRKRAKAEKTGMKNLRRQGLIR
jgi:hypothetical protein